MNTLILDEENGRIILNHNQTVVRPTPNLWPQHNQTVTRPKPLGGLTVNHNQTLRQQ